MVSPIAAIFALLAAYCLGSVLFGVLVANRAGVNIRRFGSGNVGASNVARALGSNAGCIVMALDMLKGTSTVILAGLRFGPRMVAACAFVCVLGHCFPLQRWLNAAWHGGKGAATGAGITLALFPVVGISALLVVAVLRRFQPASVASLVGVALCLVGAVFACFIGDAPLESLAALFATAVLIVIRHLPNLHRLARGEEPAPHRNGP